MDNNQKSNNQKRKELPRYLLIPIRVIALFIFVVIAFVFSLRFEFVQNWTKEKVLNYINSSYKQDISIDNFYFHPVNGFTAKILIRDHHQDTLLYASEFKLGLYKSLLSLYHKSLFLESISMNGTIVKIFTYPGEDKSNIDVFISKFQTSNANTKPLNINIKKVELTNSKIYLTDNSKQAEITFDQLNASIDSVNTPLRFFRLRKLLIEHPVINLKTFVVDNNAEEEDCEEAMQSENCDNGFGLAIDFININNGAINLELETKADSFKRYNFNSIFFSCFQLYISEDLKRSDFIHLNAKTNGDFILKNFAINHFKLDKNTFIIDKLKAETRHSNIDLKISVKFNPEENKPAFENAFIQTDIAGSLIDPNDIRYFIPQWNLYNFVRLKSEFPFYIEGKIYGTTKNLKGNKMIFKYEDQFSFYGNIHARNLLEKDKELINLKIEKVTTNASFIRQLFPEYNIPSDYDRFGNILLYGNFDGFFHDFVAYGTFETDLGDLHSDIKLKLSKKDRIPLYSGSFNATELELGKLINNPDLGKISLKAKIFDGKGLTKESMFANMEAVISDLEYKKYHYKDIQFKGNLNKDQFLGEMKISDANADLFLKGNISRIGEKYKIQINSKISKLDLKALHFTKDSLNYTGTINSDLTGSNENDMTGYFEALNSNLYINNQNIELKSIRLDQSINKNSKRLTLNSDIINLDLNGVFNLRTIKDDVLIFLSQKYSGLNTLLPSPTAGHKSSTTSINGYFFIKDGVRFNQIFRIPIELDKADCDFSFDNSRNILEISSNRFDVRYKDFFASKLSFDLASTENLNLVLTSDYFTKGQSKVTGNFKFSTNYNGQNGKAGIQIFDSTNTKLVINASSNFSYLKDTFKISFSNKDLFISNSRWRINENNLIVKTKNSFYIQKLELTDSTHYFSLQDYNKKGLILKSDGFDISFVNQLIKNKSIAFYGLFSSEVVIPDLHTLVGSTCNITIFQLHFNKDNFGPFKIDVALEDSTKPWKINIENIFQEHVIKGSGSINIPISKTATSLKPYDFSIDLDLKAFPISFLENFIASISKSTGAANGKMRFYSVDHELFLTGNMMVEKGSTYINYLGVPVHFKNQPIKFNESSIVFDRITIEDKLGNPLSLNGSLYHSNLTNFSADIRIFSPRALILDTKKGENPNYYGYGIGQIDVRFTGLFSKMDMDVSATSLEGTKINIPILTAQEATESKFVKFVNKEQPVSNFPVTENNPITGLNLNMKLSVTDDAEIQIIFDEQTGDIIKGYGRGDIIIKSLRNGVFTVNGNYEIEDGEYLFTLYNFVNKPFTITRGGTINWSGDPLNADINIEAIYEGLYASPLPLVSEYYPDETEKQYIKNQRTKVEVIMSLKGSLLQPIITFDIELPELTGTLKTYADSKLRYLRSNEDQLNQQVFGLLVMGTFINTGNFEGEVAGNIQTSAVNTISEVLGNQFSLFVSNLLSNAFDDVDFISGIDFNVGYDVRNEAQGPTNLNESEIVFSVKPRLWNDRLIFTLGGNYRSTSNTNLYGNSYFNPESVIEWNTPVKGLKLRVYYKADESIEGVKHKIGTGINYRKEFDSFLDFEGELKKQADKYKKKQNEEQ